MNGGHVVGRGGVDGLVTGLIEGFDAVEVERAAKRFIEKLNGSDDVCVGGVAESEILESGDGLGDCITLLPIDGAIAARIVEAILRSGS